MLDRANPGDRDPVLIVEDTLDDPRLQVLDEADGDVGLTFCEALGQR